MCKESFLESFPVQLKNQLNNVEDASKSDDTFSNIEQYLSNRLFEQKGLIFTESYKVQLKLFDVDYTINLEEFNKLIQNLNRNSNRIKLCEKIKLVYGLNSLTSFIIKLIELLNFSKFFSIFDITSNIKLYGFYSLNYSNPVEILIKQIRNDLFIVKSFKEFSNQEMKKEHDFHLPYKEFKRLNLNDGNLVVIKILLKNEQEQIDLAIINPILNKIEMLHLSLENESKLKPFNDLIDFQGGNLKYLKFGVNRGVFKKIPVKNSIDTLKLVNIDNLNFLNELKEDVNSLDVFFDNWELRKNCEIKFLKNFIIPFNVDHNLSSLKILNIFHTYLDSKDLNKLKYFPNLTHSKISYVVLDNDGFDLSECSNLQELKTHFTYYRLTEDPSDNLESIEPEQNIKWPTNLKKLSITIHNIKGLIQNFSIRLNILKKISAPLPSSINDLCIDISYDTGGSGPELYPFSRDDILKISTMINKILTNNLETLKLKGISRYNYKIGKPLIFSAINFPESLKLLSLNDFILDYNFINLPNLKKLYLEHSLIDSDFKLPVAGETLIEKCTFKELNHLPVGNGKIEFKMCTFRKIPTYNGDVSNVFINNCRVMEQQINNIHQVQQTRFNINNTQQQQKKTKFTPTNQNSNNIQRQSPPVQQQQQQQDSSTNDYYSPTEISHNLLAKELENKMNNMSLNYHFENTPSPTTSSSLPPLAQYTVSHSTNYFGQPRSSISSDYSSSIGSTPMGTGASLNSLSSNSSTPMLYQTSATNQINNFDYNDQQLISNNHTNSSLPQQQQDPLALLSMYQQQQRPYQNSNEYSQNDNHQYYNQNQPNQQQDQYQYLQHQQQNIIPQQQHLYNNNYPPHQPQLFDHVGSNLQYKTDGYHNQQLQHLSHQFNDNNTTQYHLSHYTTSNNNSNTDNNTSNGNGYHPLQVNNNLNH